MEREAKAYVRFFDPHGEYATRMWFHVPRVGDEIMLGAGHRYYADAAGKAAFKVLRVVWGTEGERDRFECVNIELEPLSPACRALEGDGR